MIGLTTENAIRSSASVLDRVQSIATKLRELERIAQRLPKDDQHLAAHFAHELSRCQQFCWHLVKDLERAASKQPSDEPKP